MRSPEDLQKPNVSSEEFAWDMLKCSTRPGMTAVCLQLSSLSSLKFLSCVFLVHLSNVCPKKDCQHHKCYSGTSGLLTPPELCWRLTDCMSIARKQLRLLWNALASQVTTKNNLPYASQRTYSPKLCQAHLAVTKISVKVMGMGVLNAFQNLSQG